MLQFQNDIDCIILLRFSLHLAWFAVGRYVTFIWVFWILMAYASSTTYLFTRLQKTFSSCETKEEWPHRGLYNYNGRQIELFHMKWFNRLTGSTVMSLWRAWGWCLCTDFLVSLIITEQHQNKQRFIINRMVSMLLINREFESCFSLWEMIAQD